MKKLSNLPPKGTYDWFPEEFAVRKYIFDTWRKVCLSFGFQEYLTPIVENADIYRAKSGEDVAGPELMVIKKPDEELAIRPEMTPSVTRMVTRIYNASTKPIRFFSIANFYRFQKPQRGRNREFWQLNFDIFGSDSINADIEVLQIALEIMLAFNPPKGSFTMFINNRKLIDAVLEEARSQKPEVRVEVVRILDKWEKLRKDEINERLSEIDLDNSQIEILFKFMSSKTAEELIANLPQLSSNDGYIETTSIIKRLSDLGYSDWIKFQPSIIRGFDYYDGMVFEVFDNNPENNRSMFGGGRYNGLASIFGSESFPAVGSAPGDETTRLFIESWGLINRAKLSGSIKKIFIPKVMEDSEGELEKVARELRLEGNNSVELSFGLIKIVKALDYANKKEMDFVVIYGEDEKREKLYTLKDMKNGEQVKVSLEDLLLKLK